MPMKKFKVEFTKDGQIFDQNQATTLTQGLDGVTDLLVVAHGWNNDMADAQALYDELLGNVEKVLGDVGKPAFAHLAQPANGRVFAACQVFWPSKKFTDKELIPAGGAVSLSKAKKANDDALKGILDRLAEDPDRLGKKGTPTVRLKLVERAKKLIAKLDKDKKARAEFVSVLRQLLNPDHASRDDASVEFFTEDTEKLFKAFKGSVIAPGAVAKGGAASVGAAGGAAGVRDLFEGMRGAARRIANFATYYQMKSRAGAVGASGLARVLAGVREVRPDIKLHLVGHSFGGRVVAAAANALPNKTPRMSLSLLQAAFSHNGFSHELFDDEPAFFRGVVADARASGPIIITHTKDDTAVGIAYPLASRVASQKASALGDANDPYGGMGRNGAQRTKEVSKTVKTLEKPGHRYDFKERVVYNLLADGIIQNHSDVRRLEVAYAVVCAALAL
jgi:hypothetical protein